MTAVNLLEAVATEIKSATENYRLYEEYQFEEESRRREVQVFVSYLPEDLFEKNTYYPCVTVELLDLTDNKPSETYPSIAQVGLSFGVYAKAADGWKDCFNLMQACRLRLLTKPLLADKFRLILPASWQTLQEQPRPFYFCYASLAFSF